MNDTDEKKRRRLTARRKAELRSRADHANGVWLGYYNAQAEEQARHKKQMARLAVLMERQAKKCDAIYAELNSPSEVPF